MRVQGRVQQVLPVQLAEDHDAQHIIHRQRVRRMLLQDFLKDLETAVIIQVVEPLEAVLHLGVAVERGGGNGLRGLGQGAGRQQD